ncbi:galactokinase [Treponema parvum]|uniref:galactokinase n=1 Tax=Treponema parvum TaxID=138851 RepID=UPI001AEC6259|nr:galactokinase family protein [Treponema parvum]QTQ16389.1 galactokinase [Treponema parvum]
MEFVNGAHKTEYEVLPDITVCAPGRFHLIGEHSWFFRDKTLSMAVNLPVYVAVSRREDSSLHFYFPQLNERKKTNLTSLKFKKEDRWANAVKAMLYGFVSGGASLQGLNFTIYSDILPSAGFGITTAIKIGTALAVNAVLSLNFSEPQLLQVIERGNKLFLNTGNFLADNFSALYSKKGTLLLTDHSKGRYENIPVDFSEHVVMLTDAKVPRISTWDKDVMIEAENALILGELKEKKINAHGGWSYSTDTTEINETLSVVSEDMRRRLLCIMYEHNNVLLALDGIAKKNFGMFARAVNRSHESMRDLYEISCPEIDWILKRVGELEPNLEDVRNPVTCGRITGKGFGRCLYTIIRKDDVETFKKYLKDYERIFGFHPLTYPVLPADGAHIIKN